MKKESLSKAISEAERFIGTAKKAITEIRENDERLRDGYWSGRKHRNQARAKRASLDLSITLSEMRQNR